MTKHGKSNKPFFLREQIVCMIDGKPMELPGPIKRYMNERFGKPDPNYFYVKKPLTLNYDNVVYTKEEFLDAVKEAKPCSNILFWDDAPHWFGKQIIKSNFAWFWELNESKLNEKEET